MKNFLRKFLIVMPAFFPLYLIKFSVFGVPFNVVEILVYLCAVVFIFVQIWGNKDVGFTDKLKNFFMKKKTLKSVFLSKFKTFFLPMFLFVIASSIGLIVSYMNGETRLALGIFKGWIVMPAIYGTMLVLTFDALEDKKKLVYAYMFSALFLSIWALYQVMTKNFITIDGRASGPFESANYLALYLGPIVCGAFITFWQRVENKIFAIGGLVVKRGIISKFLGKFFGSKNEKNDYDYAYFTFEVVVFVLAALALMYSRSYGGMIGVVSGIFVYAVYEIFFSEYKKFYGSLFKKLMVVLAGIILIVTAMYSQVGTQKAKDFLQFEKQSSSSVRLQVWTVAGHLITEHPVFGIGLGGFESAYSLRATPILGVPPYEKTMLHPHNLILATLLNAGILGVVALIWLFVSVFSRVKRKDRFVIMAISMFIVIIVHGLFDMPFWKNDLALIWWTLIALII